VAARVGGRSQIADGPQRMRDAVVEVYRAGRDPRPARQYIDLRGEFADDPFPGAIAERVQTLCAGVIGAG
jgi:hypothetical protein